MLIFGAAGRFAYVSLGTGDLLKIDVPTHTVVQTVSLGSSVYAAYAGMLLSGHGSGLFLDAYSGAMMVIDQASAEVTAAFPLGISPLAGEVADPLRNLVYAGGYYHQDGTPNVVRAELNRVIENFRVTGGFSPSALGAGKLWGTLNGAGAFYNMATGQSGFLQTPVTLPPDTLVQVLAGGAPPDGRTYWAPFFVSSGPGGYSPSPSYNLAAVNGFAIYNTVTNALAGRIAPSNATGPRVFSPDSSTAYLAGKQVIDAYSTHSLQSAGAFHYTTTFTALAVSPEGSVLYATDETAVYVLDAATGARKQVFALPSPPPYNPGVMALSPDGTTLYLTDSTRNTVNLIRTATGGVIPVSVPYMPGSVVVLPAE